MSRRTLIIVGGIVVLLLLGAGAYYFWQQSNAQRTATATRQTGTLTRGELIATVSGAGNINAPEQSNLSFSTGGVPITKINVEVGDQVKKGAVLAEQDASQLEQQVQIARANLASAQAKLDDLKAPPTAAELAIAEAKVNSAQANYDSAVAKLDALKEPPSALDLQATRAQLASAQANYDSALAKSKLTNEQITVARASLEKARIALQAAQAAYNNVAWRDDAPSSLQAKDLQNATIDYESAQANYSLTMAELNDSALKSAEASLAQARSLLDDLTKGASADELASARAAVDSATSGLMQAKQDLQTLKDGATQADLLAAQANVDSAQKTLDDAQRALDETKITAPFDGTVADVKGFVGQTATTGATVITLVNTANLQTQISLSEVDVSDVKAGQNVQITFDALGGRTFPGKVLSISPLGTALSGVVNYNVTVGLSNPDPSILPGMTAQASIIIAQVPDALIAPNRAVRTQGNRRVMTILYEGREIPLLVQTGLTSETGTQILSASTMDGSPIQLQEGDTVLLNTTTSTPNQGGFGAPPGGGFIPIIR